MLSRIDGDLGPVQLLTDFQQLAHHLCHLLGLQQFFQRIHFCFLSLPAASRRYFSNAQTAFQASSLIARDEIVAPVT